MPAVLFSFSSIRTPLSIPFSEIRPSPFAPQRGANGKDAVKLPCTSMVLYGNNHFFLSMSDTLRWNEYSLTYSQDYINLDYKIFWYFQQIVFPKWVWYNFSSIDRPTNRKTHYYQGCSGVVKRAYDTKYRNKNVYNTICATFLLCGLSDGEGFCSLSLASFLHSNKQLQELWDRYRLIKYNYQIKRAIWLFYLLWLCTMILRRSAVLSQCIVLLPLFRCYWVL